MQKRRQNKIKIIIKLITAVTLHASGTFQGSSLQEDFLELVSKSKKIIEVLSFVRSVLASLNRKFATFSAEFSLSGEDLSFICLHQSFQVSWLEWDGKKFP